MTEATPASLLDELLRRYDAASPLGADATSNLPEQLVAAIALRSRKRLRVIASLLRSGDCDEAAALARTLFEWAALAAFLASDDPAERERRSRRFRDFSVILADRARTTVAAAPRSEEARRQATESPESELVALRAELARAANDEGSGSLLYRWMAETNLKGLLARLPGADDWLFWYDHAYFELSTAVHPSPRSLRPEPHQAWPWAIALYSAEFTRRAVEIAFTLNKREAPNATDLIQRLAEGGGTPLRPAEPLALERPAPGDLARACQAFGVRSLALFGSAARKLGLSSDVDVLVEFEPGTPVSLFTLAGLERELSRLFGRHVDVALKDRLKPALRERILQEAQPLYGAV